MQRAGYKVVLTGEGSDEVLAGYPHFRRDLILYNSNERDPVTTQRQLEELFRGNKVSRGLLLPEGNTLLLDGVKRLLGFVPSWIETSSSIISKLHMFFDDSFLSNIDSRGYFLDFFNTVNVRSQLSDREPVNQSSYLWAKTHLTNYILSILGDRMEMAHSIEGRVPFLDHHLVEFARQLPVSDKIRFMKEKYVLREAVKHHITEAVYQRQKHPFFVLPPCCTVMVVCMN